MDWSVGFGESNRRRRRTAVRNDDRHTRWRGRVRSMRDAECDTHGTEHEDRCHQERQTEQIELATVADGQRVDEPEENGADGSCETRDARVRPLELPLFRRPDAPGHEALQGGCHKSDRCKDEGCEQENDVVRGKAPHDHRGGPEEQAREQRLPLAESLDESFHEAPLDRDVERTHEGKGKADLELPPSEAIERIQDEHGWQDLERHELNEGHAGKAEKGRMRAKQGEGPERGRTTPREALSVLPRQ